MASASETNFDLNAMRRKWEVLASGWPDRLVIREDGTIVCFEIKSTQPDFKGQPGCVKLRPQQVKMIMALEKAGITTYISNNGEIEDCLQPIQWEEVTSSNRGRLPSDKPIARATRKQYGYKRLALENQILLAKAVNGFPKEQIEQMESRLTFIDKKIKEYETTEQTAALTANAEQRSALAIRSKEMFEAAERNINLITEGLLDQMEAITKGDKAGGDQTR